MIARVVPLRRFPRGKGIYDYAIPEDLTINVGSFVLVPFKSQTIKAVVIELIETSQFKNLREVCGVDDVDPLSSADIDFFVSLAKHTYDSIGTILNAALPQKPKRKTQLKKQAFATIQVKAMSNEVDIVKSAINHIESKRIGTISVPSTSFSYLIAGILTHRQDDPLLIICPSISTMNRVASIASAYSDSVSTYGGKMSKSHAFDVALAIRRGSRSVIVTTRIGALVPPSSSTRIVVLESGNEDYHQIEQRPHYDARACIAMRFDSHKNAVTFIDVLPRVEESPLTLDLWKVPTSLVDVSISDPREKTRHWFITNSLLSAISNTDPNELFVIYHNRLEFERLILCGDCGEAAQKSKATCNSCGSTKIKSKGLGIKKVQSALSEYITDRPVTLIQSKDEIPSKGVAIATRTVLSRWPYDLEVSGVGVILSEQVFAHHDFRSLEKGRRTMRTLISNADAIRVPCVVQSMDSEMVNKSMAPTIVLFDEETKSRKMFNYPPFGTIIDVMKTDSQTTKQYKLDRNEQNPDLLTLPMNYDIIVN